MNQQSYRQVLEQARASVTDGLEEAHQQMLQVANQAPGKLSGYLNSLLIRKGKRIRATFLFLLANSNPTKPISQDLQRTARVSAAIELIHLASLVHDDIIDGSELRRNEQTAHEKWGNRVAVLVGDYALSKSIEMVWMDSDRRIPLSLSRASSSLVAGETLEIELTGNPDITLEQYLRVIEGKTGSLLYSCGECGAILAGFDEKLVAACGQLGENFGIAFQIIDDLLDLGIGAANLGKKTHSDLQNGLYTLPFIFFLRSASASDRETMLACVRSPLENENLSKITSMLSNSGSFLRAKDMAFGKIRECMDTLSLLPESASTQQLRDICSQMIHRNS